MQKNGYPMAGAWCGEFAADVVKSQGGTPPKDPQVASNWLKWESHVDPADVKPGDNVIAARTVSRFGGAVIPGQPGGHVTFVDPSKINTKDHPGQFWSEGGNQHGGRWMKLNEYELRKGDAVAKQAAAPGAPSPSAAQPPGAIKLPPAPAAPVRWSMSDAEFKSVKDTVGKYPSAMVNGFLPGAIKSDGTVDRKVVEQGMRDNPDLAKKYLGLDTSDKPAAPAADPVNTPQPAPDLSPPPTAPAAPGTGDYLHMYDKDGPVSPAFRYNDARQNTSQSQGFQPDQRQQNDDAGDPDYAAGRISFSDGQGMSNYG
jgi:hypothetical protein